jgi:hypothetical protein
MSFLSIIPVYGFWIRTSSSIYLIGSDYASMISKFPAELTLHLSVENSLDTILLDITFYPIPTSSII